MRYRYLFEQMVRRELRQKYKGSWLGVVWYVVNPLVLMGAYALMFGVLLDAVQIEDYPLFLIVGLIVWVFFSQSLLAAATSLLEQASLVGKVRFPRETVPASVVAVQLVTFLVLLVLVVPVTIAVRGTLEPELLLLVPLVACLSAFTLGLALVVSVLHAYYRDVQPILAAALLPWFFLTPIFFRVQDLPGLEGRGWAEALLRWGNPVAPFVESVRDVVYSGALPDGAALLYVAVASAVALLGGWWLFRRLQAELAVVL
ncbi:MAG TPA: ABC transporter permease [Solirubrobacteraceae bacterium]|nr:ABC transporter permease [Solirubrobacteraceae bacterium]